MSWNPGGGSGHEAVQRKHIQEEKQQEQRLGGRSKCAALKKSRICALKKNIYIYVYILKYRGFLGGSAGKESACNVGDLGSIPRLGRSPGEGTREDEMVVWHHQLDAHEFEQALGVGDGQGGLVCCSPWGCKELDMTEQMN